MSEKKHGNAGQNNPMYGVHRYGKDGPFYGGTHTQAAKEKIRLSRLGDKNPFWRGDNVSYTALHSWVTRNKAKSLLCGDCHKKRVLELSSISGEYTRDLDDWEWICRRCHMQKDGRLTSDKWRNKRAKTLQRL